MDGLDKLWADLLSGNSECIRRAWSGLAAVERHAVLDHLSRMRDGEGWHTSQRESAAAALKVIYGLAQ